MLKYIPRIIGTWLAGCYDKETLVSRVAQAGIEQFLDTEEKITQFWKRGQAQILDYAREATQETPETLSDERNTASDDAMEIFYRVQCSSLSLVTNLLLKLKSDDITPCQSKYEEYFSGDSNIWYGGKSPDASVRRAACNLLVACLDKQPNIVKANLEWIATGYIALSLREPQSTTAMLLLHAVEKLTARHPEVWDGPYRVPKDKFPSSFDILRRFVKKGSQGCPSKYWLSLQLLVQRLPSKILPSKAEAALDFLLSLRKGIEGEPKQHLEQAWSSYFDIAKVLTKNVSELKERDEVVRDGMVQIFDKYLQGEDSVPTSALAEACYILTPSTDLGNSEQCLLEHLSRFSDSLAQKTRQSVQVESDSAEQNTQGQRQVIQMAHRWFTLLADVMRLKNSQDHSNRMVVPSRHIFIAAIETVIGEHGKAYSAAAIVEMVLRLSPVLVDSETENSMKSLIQDHVPKLIMSPSSRHLVSLLPVFGRLPDQSSTFEHGWNTTIDHLIDVQPRESTFIVLKGLLEYNVAARLAKAHSALQILLLDANKRSLKGEPDAWPLVNTAISFDCFAESEVSVLIRDTLCLLNPKDHGIYTENSDTALKTLELISNERPNYLRQDQHTIMEIITTLLSLTEISDDDIAPRALKLKSAVGRASSSSGSPDQNPMLKLVRSNLELEASNPRSLL